MLEIGVKSWKWLAVLAVFVAVAGCGLNPPAHRTADGFDPPYNYY